MRYDLQTFSSARSRIEPALASIGKDSTRRKQCGSPHRTGVFDRQRASTGDPRRIRLVLSANSRRSIRRRSPPTTDLSSSHMILDNTDAIERLAFPTVSKPVVDALPTATVCAPPAKACAISHDRRLRIFADFPNTQSAASQSSGWNVRWRTVWLQAFPIFTCMERN